MNTENCHARKFQVPGHHNIVKVRCLKRKKKQSKLGETWYSKTFATAYEIEWSALLLSDWLPVQSKSPVVHGRPTSSSFPPCKDLASAPGGGGSGFTSFTEACFPFGERWIVSALAGEESSWFRGGEPPGVALVASLLSAWSPCSWLCPLDLSLAILICRLDELWQNR